MTILITGGAGYIGSHVAWALADQQLDFVVVDNLSTGKRENLPPDTRLFEADLGDLAAINRIFDTVKPVAVMHFAGSIVVPESVEKPLDYYHNNTANSLALLQQCQRHKVRAFVFSSTAAVYGVPKSLPLTENTPLSPINPYGQSKLMTELMLQDFCQVSDMRYMALRYFNVAGADPDGRTGQSTPNATHLIKIATQTALGQRAQMAIFGDDYDTSDGTCIRDYIHVSDLAKAHMLALHYLLDGGDSRVLNCGYGNGFSVRQVMDTVQKVAGKDINIVMEGRRAGDPAELVADSTAIRQCLNWTPDHDDLEFIVRTALSWEEKLAGKIGHNRIGS